MSGVCFWLLGTDVQNMWHVDNGSVTQEMSEYSPTICNQKPAVSPQPKLLFPEPQTRLWTWTGFCQDPDVTHKCRVAVSQKKCLDRPFKSSQQWFLQQKLSFTRLKLGNLLFSIGSDLIRGVYSQLFTTICGFKLTDVGSVIYALM